jgi:hypothetical protein
MLGDRGLVRANELGQLAHTPLTVRNRIQDYQPARMSQGLGHPRSRLILNLRELHPLLYRHMAIMPSIFH